MACPISIQLQVLLESASWGRGFHECFSKAAAFCPRAPSASLAAVFPACSLDPLTTLTVFKTHTWSPLGETGRLGGAGRGERHPSAGIRLTLSSLWSGSCGGEGSGCDTASLTFPSHCQVQERIFTVKTWWGSGCKSTKG